MTSVTPEWLRAASIQDRAVGSPESVYGGVRRAHHTRGAHRVRIADPRRSEESELSHVASRFRVTDAKNAFLPASHGNGFELARADLVPDECLAHPDDLCQLPRGQRCAMCAGEISDTRSGICGSSTRDLALRRYCPSSICHVHDHTSK